MIKKAILAIFILLPLIMGAQVMEKYPGISFSKLSNNGRYLVSTSPSTTILDRETEEAYQYGTTYAIGLGNAISDNGIIVGTTANNTKPCYWQDGEWHILPHDAGNNVSFGMANGISPDGKFIVGYIDYRAVSKKQWPMVSPVLWTLNPTTEEYEFSLLPEPDMDITERTPQQVSATFISEDGKTALGQVTDNRGMLEYQAIYSLDNEGKWSVRNSGNSSMIKEDAYWPPYPTRPKKPQAADYLTEEEKIAFNNANRAYLDSLEIVPLTGKNPRMPFYEDFIKENKDKYDADMANYEEENASYVTRLYEYFDAYAANLTYKRYEFNSHKLSANGRYYTANYIYPDPDDNNPDISKVKMFLSPIFFDISDPEAEPQVTINNSMQVYSISDYGCIAAASPKSDARVYSRTSYLIRPGKEPQLYSEWIKLNHPEAQKWLEENMTYSVPEGCDQTPGSQVLYGTVRLTPDETKLIATAVDPANEQYLTYFMDLAPNSGIGSMAVDNTDVVETARYDITGRRLSTPVPGINIVRYSDGSSRKILVK